MNDDKWERVEVVSSRTAALRSILALEFFSSTLALTPLLCCSPIRAHKTSHKPFTPSLRSI